MRGQRCCTPHYPPPGILLFPAFRKPGPNKCLRPGHLTDNSTIEAAMNRAAFDIWLAGTQFATILKERQILDGTIQILDGLKKLVCQPSNGQESLDQVGPCWKAPPEHMLSKKSQNRTNKSGKQTMITKAFLWQLESGKSLCGHHLYRSILKEIQLSNYCQIFVSLLPNNCQLLHIDLPPVQPSCMVVYVGITNLCNEWITNVSTGQCTFNKQHL